MKLPIEWIIQKVIPDYGVDYQVEIVESCGELFGHKLLIQLKSSKDLDTDEQEPFIKVKGFKISTYNYLINHLEVAIIIKYIQNLKKAFWIFLKDVPGPDQNHETMTILISKKNELNDSSFEKIREHVILVHNRKLKANRP